MIITLTTDFGYSDGYVGAVKGVLFSEAPEANVVDIAHNIPPQNVTAAMIALQAAVPYFPPGTVNLAVIDPGVGSSRRGIALQSNGQYFVGPDNGVFTPWLDDAVTIIELPVPDEKSCVSSTFHGRDVFAPAAAVLVAGKGIAGLGNVIDDPVYLPIKSPHRDGEEIRGEIIYIDNFGNCYTNIRSEDIENVSVGGVVIADKEINWLALYFAEAAPGDALALVNSSGYLEIAVNRGNAAGKLGITIGEPVAVKIKKDG
ncbi:MAG: SAM-dependent chlorinase/fluorinase [bacterium]|nr:SAM-dependent chlorinase/fluorinase [bacterium]